jgi:exopolysaccharide biosynthesis polyprenyl glycosylphosphotransferase
MDIIGYLNRLNIISFLKRWNLLNFILGSIDILAIAFAFQFSFNINYPFSGLFISGHKNLLLLFLLIMPIWMMILYLIKITEVPRTKRYRVLFFEYFQSAVVILSLLFVFNIVFKILPISLLFQIEIAFFGLLFLFAVRFLEYEFFKTYRGKGYSQLNIVLITDDSSMAFIENLLSKKEWGFRIIAIFSGSTSIKEKYEKDIILLPEASLDVLNDLMEVDIIDEVLYFKRKVLPGEVRNIIRSCEELGVTFRLKYTDKNINLTNAITTNISNEKFLNFINIPHNTYALSIKKIMDITLSLFIIICLLPVFITITVLTKLTSPGPVLFRQARVGLRGRQFNLYKFRTMVMNAELLRKDLESENEADGPVFKIKDDPRVTKIGKFLRKTGLDELPQLFNILKGEMSLIGPRPPLLDETRQYKRWQLRRLSVKPGISCFWQIKPNRNKIKFEKWMEMDLAYIDNWSLRLDFTILFKTIKTVFQRSGL